MGEWESGHSEDKYEEYYHNLKRLRLESKKRKDEEFADKIKMYGYSDDDEEEYEVEAIRNHRQRRWHGRMYKQYLVKWKGYPEWENTWEWEDTLANSPEVVQHYLRTL